MRNAEVCIFFIIARCSGYEEVKKNEIGFHLARARENGNTYIFYVKETSGKRPMRRRENNNIKIGFEEAGREVVWWINLATATTVVKLWVISNPANVLGRRIAL
jgi:hypothetical protein